MGDLMLEKEAGAGATVITNSFIDEYMPNASGEFVKIYLYLVRCFSDYTSNISIYHIADKFNHTEKDVIRALHYWEQLNLLTLTYGNDRVLKGIRINKIPEKLNPVKEKRSFSANELSMLASKEEIIQLLFIAEQYLGKPLSSNDTNTILYLYDTLHLPIDLIDYLIEYCVSKGHKSMRYIEKVALTWMEENITTVEKAKASVQLSNKDSYKILKAFGLTGRQPGETEKAYIVKWTSSYGFTIDIILDACNRTIQMIHQPSFEYADSILAKWKKHGIQHLDDVKALDDVHVKNKESRAHSSKQQTAAKTAIKNNFNNFPQRSYDFAELEKQLLHNQS